MKRTLTAALVAGTTLLASAPAYAVDGNLPGGTAISVAINTPANGTVLPPGPVTVTGTASVGTGVPVASTSLTYVLDVSGSTANPGSPSCGTILQCEKAAALALSARAQDGTVGVTGLAVFGQAAATADVDPSGGDQLFTQPSADRNGNGTRDIDEVISSVVEGGVGQFTGKNPGGASTNFADGIAKGRAVAEASNAMPRRIIVFLSDGLPNTGGSINVPLAGIPDNIDIYTFAVGSGADCDNAGNGEGSLEQITAATVPGGHCVQVTDVGALPDILPGVISSRLNTLSMQVDGGAFNQIGNADISPDLPQTGPASVSYGTATAPLSAGTHTICVRASGIDGGGAGSVTDCTTVVINAPPVINPIGAFSGQEGTPVSIAATVVDPDGPSLATSWSIAPQSGVDPGATCVIANPAALSTTVTCTDDGLYRLTLTADDGLNAPVSASTTVRLSNVAPRVSISAPANGTTVLRGTSVGFTAAFTDIGANDSHTCTWNFDDGTPVVPGTVNETPGSGSCTASHAFTAVGAHDALVTITDDDGDSATSLVRVVVFRSAGAFAIEGRGLVTIARTPDVTCPPNDSRTVVGVNLGVVSTGVLNASCTMDPSTGNTVAQSSVDGATLLGGLIQLSVVTSSCTSTANGVTRSSNVVGTINGQPITAGPATIGIPGVAVVHLSESTTGPNGRLVQNAVRVEILGLLGIVTQTVTLSSCYIN